MSDYLTTLRELREKALRGGGPKRIEQQHDRGKLTARERLAHLLDEESFQEFGALATHNITDFGMGEQRYPGDGIVTGLGKINGRRVAVFAQDFTVMGGSFSEVQSHKICRIQDVALESGIPLIGLNDSGGARIQEGVRSLAGYGEVFQRNVLASGVIPQISVMLGPCAGGAVYSPALTDFVIMTRDTSFMFLTGPEVIKSVTGEEVTAATLGGPLIHNCRSGVAHFVSENEHAAIFLTKLLLSYLPQNNTEDPPKVAPYDPADRMEESLNGVVPGSESEPYDMHAVIDAVFDRDSFLEIQAALRPQRHRRLRASRRVRRGHRGQPARPHGGCAGHRRQRQDLPLHPDLRRLQHSARHLRGLPGLPARRGPGVSRGHPSRRQDHLRVHRGDGPQDLHRHAQGDGRLLRRHELQADAERPGLRLAHGPDRRDGRRRGRPHPLPAGAGQGGGSGGPGAEVCRGVPARCSSTPSGRRTSARSTR